MKNTGLYDKYTVIENSTGETVENCFVLRPFNDPAARVALRHYAQYIRASNPKLADDITRWLDAGYSRNDDGSMVRGWEG